MDTTAILYRSSEQALAARKVAADTCASTMLGETFTTPRRFLEEMWELWGTGSVLVDAQTRELLLIEVLSAYSSLAHVMMSIQPLAAFVERYAGEPHFEAAVEAARAKASTGASDMTFCASETYADDNDTQTGRTLASLGETEQLLFEAIGAYFDAVEARGLIETGHAARFLESKMPAWRLICDSWLDLSPAMQKLIETVCGEPLSSIMPEAHIDPPEETCEADFLFPAGPEATLPLIKETIETFCADNASEEDPVAIAVCVSDPLGAYDALAPSLCEQGVRCALKTTMPFTQTALGRAFEATYAIVCDDAHWPQAVTDFAYGSFAGMGKQAAQQLDTTMRRDRLMTCAQARDLLRERSNTFELFEGMFGEDPMVCIAQLRQHVIRLIAAQSGVSADSETPQNQMPFLPSVELEACRVLESLFDRYEQLNVEHTSVYDIASLIAVPVSVETAFEPSAASVTSEKPASSAASAAPEPSRPPHAPYVELRSLGDLGRLADKAYDLVVVGDMSDASFRAVSTHTAYDALAEKIGIGTDTLFLDRARASFASARHAARKRFTCAMPLRDEARETAFPSFVLNEYASVLRDDDEPIDGTHFGLPCRIVDSALTRGEDAISICLGHAFASPNSQMVFDEPVRGRLAELTLRDFLYSVPQEEGTVIPVLSPSAIETYLGCPYRWFVERRVRPEQIDEGFSPLEKGTFVHDVFAHLFDMLASRGIRHIDGETLTEAEALLDEVFDDQIAARADLFGQRLAPLTNAEMLEVEALRTNMHTCLQHQALLPESFDVYAHELTITPDEGIDYAGVRLNGRTDRVDISEQAKRFVVLDYKGNLAGHTAGFSDSADPDTFVLPHKVQALIYAQALRSRFDGYACVGALYLSYSALRASDTMAGSYNEPAYDIDRLAPASSRVAIDFSAFLDLIEEKLTPVMCALIQGDIRAISRDKSTCDYCLVANCTEEIL